MFAYCLNNPVNNVDSTGMRPVDINLARHVGEGGGTQPVAVSPLVEFTNKVAEIVNDVVEYVTTG